MLGKTQTSLGQSREYVLNTTFIYTVSQKTCDYIFYNGAFSGA